MSQRFKQRPRGAWQDELGRDKLVNDYKVLVEGKRTKFRDAFQDITPARSLLQVGRKDVEGMMHGHAHEPLGSMIMIFCRRSLNRYRRIVNQTLMDPNTSRVPAQHDERSAEVNISGTEVLLAMATGLCLTGPLVWMFVRYWLFGL